MTDWNMNEFTRENLRALLDAEFDIKHATRAIDTDPTEEVILLRHADFERIDSTAVTLATMRVLPHVKVWVIEESPAWR